MVQPLQTDVQASSERSQIPVPHVELPATHCPDCALQASSPLHATPSVHVFATPAHWSTHSCPLHSRWSPQLPHSTCLPQPSSTLPHSNVGRHFALLGTQASSWPALPASAASAGPPPLAAAAGALPPSADGAPALEPAPA